MLNFTLKELREDTLVLSYFHTSRTNYGEQLYEIKLENIVMLSYFKVETNTVILEAYYDDYSGTYDFMYEFDTKQDAMKFINKILDAIAKHMLNSNATKLKFNGTIRLYRNCSIKTKNNEYILLDKIRSIGYRYFYTHKENENKNEFYVNPAGNINVRGFVILKNVNDPLELYAKQLRMYMDTYYSMLKPEMQKIVRKQNKMKI